MTFRDLQLIAQSLAFLRNPPAGPQIIGIVCPDGSTAGRRDAEGIADLFGRGIEAGALVLHPKVLTVQEAARGRDIIALLLTVAVLADARALAASLQGRGVLTIATEPAAVTQGLAVMAVRTEPRVEIVLSRSAAEQAGVEFSTAFRMMIQER